MFTTESLALWGSLLSTILAFLKIKEWWDKRFRIEVLYDEFYIPNENTQISDSGYENQIYICNLTNKPIIIKDYSVFKKDHAFTQRKKIENIVEYGIFSGITPKVIPANDVLKIGYCNEDAFIAKKITSGKLFVRLDIVGQKKPKYYQIYPNNWVGGV